MKEAQELHKTYCETTGMVISLGYDRQRAWFDYIQAGFTKVDLELVIRFLKKGIASQERNQGCLRFRNLVQQLDYFEEELAMARKALNARQRPQEAQLPHTVQTGPGEAVTRLDSAPQREPMRVNLREEAERILRENRPTNLRNVPPKTITQNRAEGAQSQ